MADPLLQPTYTSAVRVFFNGHPQPAPLALLCLKSEAESIMVEVGATDLREWNIVDPVKGPNWTFVPNGETRRIWEFQMPDGHYERARSLLDRKFNTANGPRPQGRWIRRTDSPGDDWWIPWLDSDMQGRPEWMRTGPSLPEPAQLSVEEQRQKLAALIAQIQAQLAALQG